MRETYRYDRRAGAVVCKPEPQLRTLIEMLPCPDSGREFRDLQELMQISLAEMCSNALDGKPAESTMNGVLRVPTGMTRRQYWDAIMRQYTDCWMRQVAKLYPKEYLP